MKRTKFITQGVKLRKYLNPWRTLEYSCVFLPYFLENTLIFSCKDIHLAIYVLSFQRKVKNSWESLGMMSHRPQDSFLSVHLLKREWSFVGIQSVCLEIVCISWESQLKCADNIDENNLRVVVPFQIHRNDQYSLIIFKLPYTF